MSNSDSGDFRGDEVSKERKWQPLIFSIIVGLFAFILVVGPRALQPRNIAWLSDGDPATHYLGWLFFRNSDWSFPIGLNPRYGLEVGNAILFSDSNPMLAILFKPFSHFLPETFQYFGIWLLACFVLQAWFAFRLVGLFTEKFLARAIAASFFVFAPPMLWRLHGHLSLVGHFLILASLYFALNPSLRDRKIGWAFLLVASALTHAYLLIMVGLVWTADILGRSFNKSLRLNRAGVEFLIVFSATCLACWQAGYFSVGDGTSSGGFGLYRMNLLSIFDSSGWSYVLSDIPGGVGDYEGFNYLGLGMIFLGICAFPIFLMNWVGVVASVRRRPILLLVVVFLTAFSVTNNLGIASINIGYEVPDSFLHLANIFRASGRMFWPVFYLLYVLIILLVVRGYSNRIAAILLGIGLIIQTVDTSKTWLDIRGRLMTKPRSTWETKMVAPFWSLASTRYSNVRLLTLGNDPAMWRLAASYAGTHGLATDATYLARIGRLELQTAHQKVIEALQFGLYDVDSLYIFDAPNLEQLAKNLDAQSDLFAKIDGIYVLAPGWKKCGICPNVVEEIDLTGYLPKKVSVGDRLLFSQNETGLKYLGGGWSDPEDWGAWSNGSNAVIVLPLENGDARTILVNAKPFVSSSHSKQSIEIQVNGVSARPVSMSEVSGDQFRIEIPEDVYRNLSGVGHLLRIQFRFVDAVSPSSLGISADDRSLGIGLLEIRVQ